MVDPIYYAIYYAHLGGNKKGANHMSGLEQPSGPFRICTCKHCEEAIYQHAVKPRFRAYTRINPLVVDSMTEHQYFLCDQSVEAFIFKTRSWGRFYDFRERLRKMLRLTYCAPSKSNYASMASGSPSSTVPSLTASS